jgi:hypothetical protein
VVGQYIIGNLNVNTGNTYSKAIKIQLECVEALVNDPSGFAFVAHFEYENDNQTAIFIANGPDNMLVASGGFFGHPPQWFQRGEGHFDVFFDGNKLTWILNSYNKGKKTAVASDASSSSNRCHWGSGDSDSNVEIKAFPNPAADHVAITVTDLTEKPSSSDLSMYDNMGQPFPVRASWNSDYKELGIDLSGLNSGYYLIYVRTVSGLKSIRVLKE